MVSHINLHHLTQYQDESRKSWLWWTMLVYMGVDEAHSCQAVSTSKAMIKGFCITVNLKRGCWKSQNTFAE